jgi:hypothetical protein
MQGEKEGSLFSKTFGIPLKHLINRMSTSGRFVVAQKSWSN